MNARLKKGVLVNAGWFLGLGLTLVALIGASFLRLNARKARLLELQQTVEHKLESLRQGVGPASLEREQAGAKALSSEWLAMVTSESRMVSELSEAARRAGVTLVDIKCLAQELSEDGMVVSVTHELGALGSYRELGRFLSGLYRCSGAVGIDGLEIEREAHAVAAELKASLRVTWYANGPGKPAEDTSEEQG